MAGKVYIIILNWNGWKDTIECLESVFCNHYDNYTVVVCDNDSSDNSLEKIKQWADGTINVETKNIESLEISTRRKPISYITYSKSEAEAGGFLIKEPELILIKNGNNFGFAGGNNVGIRYALAKNEFDYIWLLNNDTVIKTDALIQLVKRVEDKPTKGICGSTLIYYHRPDKVQAFGGATFNKWICAPKHIGELEDWEYLDNINADLIEKKMDYVVGASMLVTRKFIVDIGLLSEDYFLYYEEMDWATRAKGFYDLAYAPQSIVYHKEGSTIGSSRDHRKNSFIADYYLIKNRIVFTKKFFKYALPTVYLGIFVTLLRRIIRFRWDRVAMIIRILFFQ